MLSLILSACHQEGFILLRNLERAEWFDVKDFLAESGLEMPQQAQSTNQISRPPSQPPSPPSVPQESRYMTIPPNKEFIIQLSGENTLISLKSTTGVTYLKDASDPAQKIFTFLSSTNNGRAIFQYYDLDGKLQKNLTYYFRIQHTPTTSPTNIVTRKPTLPTEDTNTQTNISPKPSSQNIDWFLASLQALPPGEAIKNLEQATTDATFSDTEKERLNYTLIEYYLKQRLLTKASNRIETLQDRGYRAYYRGLYYESLQRPTRAIEYLIQALDEGGSVLGEAIVATSRVMINGGISDSTLTSRLDTLTASLKDKNRAAQSMIQIAQLYEGLRNPKRAKELYQTIIQGDYPKSWKQQAEKNLALLEQTFR
ncbi:MAG: hypothetical protein N2314_06995 [Brevinematales bacterium]|nr:hypothetical protein [Brevinematales bacterium]